MLSNLFFVSTLALATLASEPHVRSHVNRHHDIAQRASGDVQLHKRFSSARWSFYDVGLGACGKYNVATDYIVALNSNQFGSGYPGPYCFQTITMNYNGKTAQATIMDECPGCPYGGLDLSRGLFTHFASEDTGIIYGTWSFNDGSSDPTTTTTKQTPTTTTTHKPKTTSTSTYTPETTSTTKKPDPTTTSTTAEKTTTSTSTTKTSSSTVSSTTSSSSVLPSSTVTPSSTTSIDYSSGAASGLAVATGTISDSDGSANNLQAFNVAIVDIGGLLAHGATIN